MNPLCMNPLSISKCFLAAIAAALLLASAARAGDSASGSITANGTATTLTHVRAMAGEPYNGDDVVQLVISEKDASGSEDPMMDVMFDRLGAAISVKLRKKDMSVIGCVVSHPSLKRSGINVIGQIQPKDVALADGRLSGRLTTDEPVEFFDDTFEVALSFDAAVP
ncbi:MAG: hypothetical protein R3F22_03865 [Lysobacteraceae bacterium]